MLHRYRTFASAVALLLSAVAFTRAAPVAIAVHGGAGTLVREEMTQEREAEYRAELERALRAGHAVLVDGGSAVDAVVAAIVVLEDSPLFNAGRGAVFTHDGMVELDASLMDGYSNSAGAAAGVRTVRNPIRLARAVMEDSPHVLLAGRGAEEFATEQGLELVANEYFHTERRRSDLDRVKASAVGKTTTRADGANTDRDTAAFLASARYGTVGAVALDASGRLAAGTSTGGMTNKRWGRIGDSPLIGAGTFADRRCAVSCTGHGEYFIRGAIAYDVAARMDYAAADLDTATRQAIHEKLARAGGTGGLVAMDVQGNVAMPFNTRGMYRGAIHADGRMEIAIFADAEN
ncbi:isoaspartyl peptidase/L-asparaginase [Opitutales bacterium ASA1]|uniref:isoaspartyl peptidase/L-asparaginase family protein n=1 Tax=Congregicoccus parvus TaxID=3081749 RepID=UPI002B2F89A1|nr:isoaspartyl peptidase/L-asparaginase [Opitutales bacterium ASA1]